jgi:hypothetical protein
MSDLFLTAARGKFRFRAANGLLTTEQLFDLPLTSSVGKANLNDIAVGLADQIDKTGTRSFVSSASTTPERTRLINELEIVKAVIGIREAENASNAERAAKRAQREKILDAIEAAETRELGSQSAADLRAQLAALDG